MSKGSQFKRGVSKKLKVTPKLAPNPERWNGACSPVDAMHPDRVADHLPGMRETYLEAQHLEEIADTASRAGGGGAIAGHVGLRPRGMKNYTEFHERFTKEKEKKILKEPPPMTPDSGKRWDGPPFKLVTLPETFCVARCSPGCQKNSVPPGTGCLNISPLGEAWPGFDLKPGDVMRYYWCAPCGKVMKEGLNGAGGLKVMAPDGTMVPLSLIRAIERSKKIDENVERFLRAAKLAGTPDVFPKGD